MTKRLLLGLVALAVTAPLAHAQDAFRPYARIAGGGGVVNDRFETGRYETLQNAGALGGSVEAGIQQRRWSVGLEVAALRRGGTLATNLSLVRTGTQQVTSHASALVISRARFAVGPVDLRVGTGIGVSRTIAEVREATRPTVTDGELAYGSTRRREVRVQPLFSSDVTVGHEVGRTFVGLGMTNSYGASDSFNGAVRYGLVLEQRF